MGSPLSSSPANRSRLEAILLGLIAVGVLWFYAWIDSPARPLFGHAEGQDAYYNLLIRGFAKGQVSLDQAVDPQLLASRNPYDPAERTGFVLHDATLYHGHYYLYFGAAPALVLYWPFHLISGSFLQNNQAAFLFAAAGFLTGTGLLLTLRRQHFPDLSTAALALSVLVWGLAPMLPLLLRRSQFWEVPIAAAFAFYLVCLFALVRWYHFGRKARWLWLASTAFGLAIASRPTYLFGAVILLLPLVCLARDRSARSPRALLTAAAATLLPIGAIGGAMLAYNQARFGSPLEFGMQYQLTDGYEAKVTHFSPTYFWYDLRAYFLAPAQPSVYFPFVREAPMPAAPRGHEGAEDPYGILPNIPFLCFAFLVPLAWARRESLRVVSLTLILAFAAIALPLLFFVNVTDRYLIDFVPGLALLAVLGFWGALHRATGRTRHLVRVVACATAAWSLSFNAFAALGHLDLLKTDEPALYLRLVHAFNTPRHWFDQVSGHTYGPLEVTVRFPQPAPPGLECLLVTGTARQGDFIYLTYPAADHLVLGAEDVSHGGPKTEPLAFAPDRPHRLRLELGSLYPPEGDPYYDGLSRQAVLDRQEQLRVSLDGREVLVARHPFYPGVRRDGLIGNRAGVPPSFGGRFTGEVLSTQSLDEAGLAPDDRASAGAIALTVTFPNGPGAKSEPLVATGDPGRADVLSVHYLDARHVTFSLDHWSHAPLTSGPVVVDPAVPQRLIVSFGSFYPPDARPATVSARDWESASRRLTVILNDQIILDQETDFYPVDLATVVIGQNTPGSSSCGPEFTGRIIRREQSLAVRPPGPERSG